MGGGASPLEVRYAKSGGGGGGGQFASGPIRKVGRGGGGGDKRLPRGVLKHFTRANELNCRF